jgi:uncharacterized protein (DUF3820 family)
MSNHPEIIMPFGKHKGTEIGDIPKNYLDWLIGQEWFQGDLRQSIADHLNARRDWEQMDASDE